MVLCFLLLSRKEPNAKPMEESRADMSTGQAGHCRGGEGTLPRARQRFDCSHGCCRATSSNCTIVTITAKTSDDLVPSFLKSASVLDDDAHVMSLVDGHVQTISSKKCVANSLNPLEGFFLLFSFFSRAEAGRSFYKMYRTRCRRVYFAVQNACCATIEGFHIRNDAHMALSGSY